MDLFRYSRDVYGQSTLEGMSFELVWLFIGAAAAIIIAHLIWAFVRRKTIKTSA